MSRFRLRFLLQEFDLPLGETLIGRSPDCHITIEDPLISRHHAKIVVAGAVATFIDLGSRNGSRVNGRLTTDPTVLADADRLRLGAQELVFLKVGSDRRMARSTGAMRLCARCKTPFPEGPDACPHCGHAVVGPREEETLAGINVPTRRGWILQLLGEVLERALATGKLTEADRLLRRAAEETEDRVQSGEVDGKQLGQISDYAIELATKQQDGRWVIWVLDMHRQAERVPQRATVARLRGTLDIPGVAEALYAFVTAWNDRKPGGDDAAQLQELAEMVSALPVTHGG